MLERVETAFGEFETRTFTVNVRTPQISGGGEVKLKDREKMVEAWAWDEKLTLEFNGESPTVSAIEITAAEVPTIFLLGDSTVCDQPQESYSSWGQMLPRFFGPGVAVANHAESGESLRSSLGARRLDKVLSLIKPGDYLFIQYGHNDQNNYGAYGLARCVVEGIKANNLNIAKFLAKDVTGFDPSHPDPPENFKIPASPLRSEVKPPGN